MSDIACRLIGPRITSHRVRGLRARSLVDKEDGISAGKLACKPGMKGSYDALETLFDRLFFSEVKSNLEYTIDN